ncbi:tumor necrosis factor receptor superfamily member 5 isoform X2 [Choloepus didactylus]|uniref:tumor necrosis factor receptor superfamily member 5 isoform X2 n=1 Tax=Choloepus didactylus TaxID=27675 RepID=UPI00189EBDF2|nr:tumor necrosis factor receptor superfamily member 5 isoform X2 [Choloepus didactylus]
MVRLSLQCLVWGCLLTTVHPEPFTACGGKQYQINSQCCKLCPPGEKLVNDCTKVTETECQLCGAGEFLDTWNREHRCHQHKYCDPNLGLRVQREGTTETDTTCACKKGLHCTGDNCESCAQHRLCPPGFGVKQAATGVSDTVCEPCPIGFFSSVSSAFEKCRPWTSCESQDLVVLQEGTNKTDAHCGSRPLPSRKRALVVIPIAVGLLFAVLFIVLSACVCKAVKKPENKAYPVEDVRKAPEETIFLEDIPCPTPVAPVQETLHGCQLVTQEDGKDSRISVQERQ